MENDDKNKDQTTLNESGLPFTDALAEALDEDPNEERKERLKQAIKNHALANRKVVKARRLPRG